MKRSFALFGQTFGIYALLFIAHATTDSLQGQQVFGSLRGVTRTPDGAPLAAARIVVHNVASTVNLSALSGENGAFLVDNLSPAIYQITAIKQGYADSAVKTVEVAAEQSVKTDFELAAVDPKGPPETLSMRTV